MPNLEEASGMEASLTIPGLLYSHNDHGGDAELFAFFDDGLPAGRIVLEGVDDEDYEDISIGGGPEPGRDYIYVANTGNNHFDRVFIEVIHQRIDSSGLHILLYPALHNCFKAPFLLGICFPVEKLI